MRLGRAGNLPRTRSGALRCSPTDESGVRHTTIQHRRFASAPAADREHDGSFQGLRSVLDSVPCSPLGLSKRWQHIPLDRVDGCDSFRVNEPPIGVGDFDHDPARRYFVRNANPGHHRARAIPLLDSVVLLRVIVDGSELLAYPFERSTL